MPREVMRDYSRSLCLKGLIFICLCLIAAPLDYAEGAETCCMMDVYPAGGGEKTTSPLRCMDVPITAGGDGKDNSPAQLVQCINSAGSSLTREAASQLWSDDVARMRSAGAWWSSAKAAVPVTVVTQTSISRLPQLWAQCRSWRGPLSAAVYAPMNNISWMTWQQHLGCLMHQVYALFLAAQADPLSCDLDIILLHEYVEQAGGAHYKMPQYPVNVLRNIARLQARTEVLAMVDVDMLMSADLFHWLQDAAHQDEIIRHSKEKAVYVLPAFEVAGDDTVIAAKLADTYSVKPKSVLLQGIQEGALTSFALARYPLGHNQTNFTRWASSSEAYQVDYVKGFEPWLMTHRELSPWHDSRFRGYGLNKISHIAHLDMTQHRFLVHPSAFIIHRAHEKSSARRRFNADMARYYQGENLLTNLTEKRRNSYFRVHHLFAHMKQQMERSRFTTVLDPATENCRANLAWWTVGFRLRS